MSFFGFFSSPVSVPPVFDTTPCMEHLMEYEDCVIDVGTDKKQFFMPAWPTLYPGLQDGKTNLAADTRTKDIKFNDTFMKDPAADHTPLTNRQKQLLYECEEERMVSKACFRDLVKRKRTARHTSWDTAEAATMCLS